MEEKISNLLETALIGGIAIAGLGLLESMSKKESGNDIGLFRLSSNEKKAGEVI